MANTIDEYRVNSKITAFQEISVIADDGDNMAKEAYAKIQELRAKIAKAKAEAVRKIDEEFAEELKQAEGQYIFRLRLMQN